MDIGFDEIDLEPANVDMGVTLEEVVGMTNGFIAGAPMMAGLMAARGSLSLSTLPCADWRSPGNRRQTCAAMWSRSQSLDPRG